MFFSTSINKILFTLDQCPTITLQGQNQTRIVQGVCSNYEGPGRNCILVVKEIIFFFLILTLLFFRNKQTNKQSEQITMKADLLNVQNFTPTGFQENKIQDKKTCKFCQKCNCYKITYLIKYTLTVQFSIQDYKKQLHNLHQEKLPWVN